LYEKIAALVTDRFINVSTGEYESALALGIYGKEKARVIYNGTEPLTPVTGAKEAVGLSGKFVVLTLTRYDYAKNMNMALAIAEKLRRYSDIVFLWIGEGEERSVLEALSQKKKLKNVVFADFTHEITKYLSASDIYLSTSRREGLPLALLEACSIGLPIVATDVVGNNEVVTHGLNGLLFQPNSPDDAVESILKLYRDRESLEKMSSHTKKVFDEKFRVEPMVERTVELYREITKAR
jgi:glycosyltransferase involved in cell wall biosynthesis